MWISDCCRRKTKKTVLITRSAEILTKISIISMDTPHMVVWSQTRQSKYVYQLDILNIFKWILNTYLTPRQSLLLPIAQIFSPEWKSNARPSVWYSWALTHYTGGQSNVCELLAYLHTSILFHIIWLYHFKNKVR